MIAISFVVVTALSFQPWLGYPDATWYLPTKLSPRKKVDASPAQAHPESSSFIHIHVCAGVCLHVCMCACTCAHSCVHIYVCACWHVCMHTCMHVSVYYACTMMSVGLHAHHQCRDPSVLFLLFRFHSRACLPSASHPSPLATAVLSCTAKLS
jgi:hypothetical protein